MDKINKKSIVIGLVKYLVINLFTLAILLLSSGVYNWIGAWTLFGFSMAYQLFLGTLGKKYFPETLKGRSETKFIYTWDKMALLINAIGVYSQYLIAGITYRYSINFFNPILYTFGSIILGFGIFITLWVLFTNPYAIGSARKQDDRNQKLISNGPYRIVRHPMYFSVILTSLSTPLILGSIWAFIPIPIIIGSFIFRCYKEDTLLMTELEGYKEYSKKVKHRMIPFIW